MIARIAACALGSTMCGTVGTEGDYPMDATADVGGALSVSVVEMISTCACGALWVTMLWAQVTCGVHTVRAQAYLLFALPVLRTARRLRLIFIRRTLGCMCRARTVCGDRGCHLFVFVAAAHIDTRAW